MKSKLFFFIILLTFFCFGCKTSEKKYQEYIQQANDIISGDWFYTPTLEGFEEALAFCDKAMELDPNNWLAYHTKLQLYRLDNYLEPNYKEMVNLYEKWLANGNSLEPMHKLGYGCALLKNNEKDKAQRLLKEATEVVDFLIKNNKKTDNQNDVVAGIIALYILEELDLKDIDKYIRLYAIEDDHFKPYMIIGLQDTSIEELSRAYAGL